MRHKILLVSSFLLAILFILSCTVSKRHYRKGYHVEWLSKADHRMLPPVTPNEKSLQPGPVAPQALQESRTVTVPGYMPLPVTYTNGCDVIIFRAGEELEVKVVEVLPNSVKYKYCERPDGPTYETLKKDIFMVKYASGTREVFDKNDNTSTNNNGPIINSGSNGPIINSGEAGSNSTKHDSSGDRSFWVTLVLLLLVGVLGVHRFYLGQYTMGILYLFSFGICGIGVIVDLILLLTGNLEPEYGDFFDKPDGF